MTTKEKIENAVRLARIIRLARTLKKRMEAHKTGKNTKNLLDTAIDALDIVHTEYEFEVLERDEGSRHLYRLIREYV